jgi:hypothetical protein
MDWEKRRSTSRGHRQWQAPSIHLIQFITESVEKHGGNAPDPSVFHPFLSAP